MTLDRAAHGPTQPRWLDEALRAEPARLVLLWRDRNLVGGEGRTPEPVLIAAHQHPELTIARENRFESPTRPNRPKGRGGSPGRAGARHHA